MTFLDPWYLAALSGALVPIALHFLARRRIRSRPFSSLVFLRAVERSAIRWARLAHYRLLAVRVALLALTALALARPTCGRGLPAVTLIALDGSASMGAERGLVWRRAQDAALALLAHTTGRVEVATATGTLQVRHMPSQRERTDLVRRLAPQGVALDMARVLLDAAAYARQMGGRVRLVLVSDFQSSGWIHPQEVPPGIDLWGAAIPGMRGNLSLGRPSFVGTVRGKGALAIAGAVMRFGATDDSCQVTVVTPHGEDEFTLRLSGDETPFLFPIPRPGDGLCAATVVVDDRLGLVFDDRREVARWATDSCRVAVVGPRGDARTRLLAALDPEGDGRWGFDVQAISGVDLPADPLDAIIVLGAPGSDECADACLRRWSEGTGLVLIPVGEELTDAGATLHRRTLGVTPQGVRNDPGAPVAVRYDHPVLSPFRYLAPNGFAPPQVNRLWSSQGTGVPLIGLGDAALLVESSASLSRRAIGFMTGIVPPWSDWASRASFVPLMQLAVDHVAGSLGVTPVRVGAPFTWEMAWFGEGNVSLEMPGPATLTVTPHHLHAGVARVTLGPFVDPGLYVLRRDGNPVALFEPVAPVEESIVAPAIQPASVSGWVDPSHPPWSASRTRELATLLLAAALGLLVGEAWLALRITRGAPAPPRQTPLSPSNPEVLREP